LISKRLNKVFSTVRVHMAAVPLYGVGEFSFTIASDLNLCQGITISDLKRAGAKLQLKLRYWSPEIHLASAVLPKTYDFRQ
jgi:spermidine synthase